MLFLGSLPSEKLDLMRELTMCHLLMIPKSLTGVTWGSLLHLGTCTVPNLDSNHWLPQKWATVTLVGTANDWRPTRALTAVLNRAKTCALSRFRSAGFCKLFLTALKTHNFALSRNKFLASNWASRRTYQAWFDGEPPKDHQRCCCCPPLLTCCSVVNLLTNCWS
jgi:hypothetical protein